MDLRIQSPADRASEVGPLVDAGAEELYAGYVPPFWAESFGPVVSCNRRTFPEANVPTMDELEEIVHAAALRDVPVYVALNASPIPDAMIGPMAELATALARRGVRGAIVSDLPFLLALREKAFRRFEIHASTLFSAFNRATVAFLRRAGAARVILARELTVSGIAAMASAVPRTPVEVIGFRGRCPNIEGFCTHLHDDPGRRWPCELRYEKRWSGDGRDVPEGIRRSIERNEGTDRHFSCGLCAIPLLARAGVHAIKIVGRGAETSRKIAAVAAVRWMRDRGRDADRAPRECARRGKALFREMHGRPCRAENCYFPEFAPGGGDPEGGDAA